MSCPAERTSHARGWHSMAQHGTPTIPRPSGWLHTYWAERYTGLTGRQGPTHVANPSDRVLLKVWIFKLTCVILDVWFSGPWTTLWTPLSVLLFSKLLLVFGCFHTLIRGGIMVGCPGISWPGTRLPRMGARKLGNAHREGARCGSSARNLHSHSAH